METILRAENVAPNWILIHCTLEKEVSLPIKKRDFMWRVDMFIWGGKDYIKDVEENTYKEVLYLVAVVTYKRKSHFTSTKCVTTLLHY